MAANIHDCKTQYKSTQDRLAAIEADADKAGDFTPEAWTEYQQLSAQADTLEAKIKAADEASSLRERNAQRRQAFNPDATTGRRSQPNPTHVGRVKEGFEDDPKRGFASHREYLGAVMAAGIHGHTDDPRLKSLSVKNAAAGGDEHGGHSDSHGGYLQPRGFSPDILAIMAETDPTIGRTRQIPMDTTAVDIPARVDKNHSTSVSGGLRVYRRAETQSVSDSRAQVELVELKANSLMGVTYASEELLARSPSSFLALIETGFRDEFGAKLLNEKLNGTGSGQYEGVLNSPATITVNKETGQDADTIIYKNAVNMRARCWRYDQAIWLANHDTLPQLMHLVLPIGTSGVPMWQSSAREGEPNLLLGRPIFFTEFCEAVGDKGDLVLGNWGEYLEGTLGNLEQAESIHVRFLNYERTFRFSMNNDGRVWWRSPLTPKKSASTLSPFVVLQARA